MTATITDLSVATIDGKEKPLAEYAGNVLLIVNVASRCGYTPQYTGLEQLYRKYHAQGLEVLAFPSNDYGAQEPGTNEEIAQFCSTKYDVTFPLFDKVHAKGAQQHPLYARLTAVDAAGDVAWNFEKFLVNKQGEVVARFKSAVKPDAPELISAIERELAQ
ncbi:glutathione peroxidase [Stenomitos frigidus]|uniref:Glutathione peroxidase n=1 Tax=Stenomitos frigidus ULC18 TaxID=2107698 RepID=A0A2T1DSS5_9CYAN|nr:glutathione peroxidase [Stenomitos frigidus]PSB23525.1 glutathione peroxidase [Stenomitos frigidus ULC18]